ncbi:MAG TPA: hypothetical protein DIU39_02765 [Flavobacteriales bacterium]|nr:hypothetical protein [Flavobacteriales bacterium]|tara:strand:+ start:67262 stop:67984 length:723 start_codon:yes stop_codon:yes gene_type:complete
MIEYIVIDDETAPRELLIYTIDSLSVPLMVVGQSNNLLDGVELIKKLKPQLVFLDIQMPLHNGLKIRKFLSEKESNFHLVFITAYEQYTIQAIRLSAFDYLLKPIDTEELKDCIYRVIEQNNDKNNIFNQLQVLDKSNNNVLVIKSHEGTQFVNVEDIITIEADGMYSKFNLKNQTIISSKPLKMYEAVHTDLFRCHRSYIVNINTIEKLDSQFIKLRNNEKIPISRAKKNGLFQLLSLK